jgi:Homeodomain-like domain
MDRGLLKRYLDEGLSLPQIGALVGRPPSTVGYWVQKYGFFANGHEAFSPRGSISRELLEPLARSGMTLTAIADELGVSESTIRYWIRKYGLPSPKEIRQQDVQAAIKSGSRTVIRVCKRHGETEFALVGRKRHPRCKLCRSEAVARRRLKVKEILVREHGGECRICGFDRHVAALEFHHLDPHKKSFGLAKRGITRSIEQVREEARKCILLCSNCHAMVEAGAIALPADGNLGP